MTTNKLCLFCRFMDVDLGTPGYSEWTPGSPAVIECIKGHWKLYNDRAGIVEYTHCLQTARHCKDFTERTK